MTSLLDTDAVAAVERLDARIEAGEAYVFAHPDDRVAKRLLRNLNDERTRQAVVAVKPLLDRFGGVVVSVGAATATFDYKQVAT